ncbi:MAG: acyltransferase domain-containing protein [Acidimicrobiales bacterium]|jgi:hypothetical protein
MPGTGVAIAQSLGFDQHETGWAKDLEALGEPPYEVTLPAPPEAMEILERLGVPELDAAEVVSTLPWSTSSPEWWWLLERSTLALTQAMDNPDISHFNVPSWVGPDRAYPLQRRCFMAHVFLAVMPHTRAWHRARGIADDISWASLADLGRHMEIHRRMYGSTGVDAAWWLTMSLRAEAFVLGRLQFNWFHLGVGPDVPWWYPPAETEARGEGFRMGDVCVGVHIPESGPITPAACDESLAMAKAFFAQHLRLTDQTRRLGVCWSWLLDDQLAQWLPEQSNIVQFQRRFELVPGALDDDEAILEFVFRVPDPLDHLDVLPQRTTLERAVVAHLRAGGHWRSRSGWVDL